MATQTTYTRTHKIHSGATESITRELAISEIGKFYQIEDAIAEQMIKNGSITAGQWVYRFGS